MTIIITHVLKMYGHTNITFTLYKMNVVYVTVLDVEINYSRRYLGVVVLYRATIISIKLFHPKTIQ